MTTAERDSVEDQLCARIDELEAEKEALASQLDRAEEERDYYQRRGDRVAEERDVLVEQVAYWRERAEGAVAERDALAAHVDDVRAAYMPGSYDTTSERLLAVGRVLNQSPKTSLARQKAEWQAEALDGCAEYLRSMGVSVGMLHVQEYAAELRRQAEGGPHD